MRNAPSQRIKDYTARHFRSGGVLNVPRTPVEKILLHAKLKRLRYEFEQRQAR